MIAISAGLVLHREGEILGAGEDALHLFLSSGILMSGRVAGTLLAVGDSLLARLVQRLLEHFGHQRAAVELLDVRDRHLALAGSP